MAQKHPHRFREKAAQNRRKKARELKAQKRERRKSLSGEGAKQG
jgi:hypothetical protein